MQGGPAGSHGLGGGDGLRGSLCMRRPRLSRGLPLWEARRGACACGGKPNPATWATWDVRASACGGNLPVGPRLSAGEGAAQGGGVLAPLRAGNAPKELLFPGLCPSCAGAAQRLPFARGLVYSSPSRRTPVSAAARTPRTGYCGRRRRSDRPFGTGFIRWLENGETLSQAPVFHEFLESIYFFQL